MTTTASEITVVTGRRACRSCDYVNESGNEYCVHCGGPMGNVPELIGDPSLAAQNRVSWQVYGIDTRLVGRQRELDHLTDRFRRTIDTGQLHVTVLSGAVGLGKSRLIDEFSRVINTTFGNALLISGAWRDSSEGGYAIVDRVLRNRFYIPERLPEDEARERLLEGIMGIVKNPVALEITHRIGALVDLPFPNSPFGASESPDEAREASWRALAKLMRTDAAANPLVVVLEDLHHASTEALDLIPFLAKALTDAPILCVLSASPDVLDQRPDLFAAIPNFERIDLRPLADDDIRSIVDQVLSRASDIPDVVYRRVCDNAIGNPWIAEEILRLMMAHGAVSTLDTEWRVRTDRVVELHLPRGVDDIVHAGLAILTPQERELLERAAVVGDVFWVGPLNLIAHHLSPVPEREFLWEMKAADEDLIIEALRKLAEKDLIRLRLETRYPNEMEWVFKHAAVRRHLLENLDPELRAVLHGRVAQWHEINRAMGLREIDAVIAEHHEQAGNLGRAAYAFRAAGQRAQEHYDHRAALGFYNRALELLDDSHLLERLETLHEISGIYDLIGDYENAIPPVREMLRCAWRLASLAKGGAGHNKLGRVLRSLGRHTESLQHFDQALHLFRRANDRVGIASTLDDIGKVHWIKASYKEALEYYKEAMALRRDLGDKRSLALSLNHLGTLQVVQGDFKEALIHFREALALRKEIGDRRGVADSLNNLGIILAERGDQPDAIRLWQEAAEVAREIGDRPLEGMLFNNMGEIACELGELDDAEKYLSRAAEISEECAEQRLLFDVTRNRGLLELRRNQAERALTLIESALELAKRLDMRALEGIALRSLADVHAYQLVGSSEPELHLTEAERAFQGAIDVLEAIGQEAELGRALLAYGTFLVEQGLLVRARKQLEAAKAIFGRIGMQKLEKRAAEVLADLHPG